jgi:hypothetical protein
MDLILSVQCMLVKHYSWRDVNLIRYPNPCTGDVLQKSKHAIVDVSTSTTSLAVRPVLCIWLYSTWLLAMSNSVYVNAEPQKTAVNICTLWYKFLEMYLWHSVSYCETKGRAMAQAVSRRPPTAEARFRSRVSPCGICGGKSGTGTGFFPEYFGFPLSISFHRCSITRNIIIFISIGSHSKPHGCSASVATAAVHLTTTKNLTSL